MRSVIVSKALAAASATNIATAQTLGAAGPLTLNGALVSGGVAVMDTPRRVRITTAGDSSARTITIVGTNESGTVISESMTAPATATKDTASDYATVTSVSINGASTGNVSVGTMTTGATRWVNADTWAKPFSIGINCSLTGSATFSVETTNSDYLNAAPSLAVAQATSIAGATSGASVNITAPCRGWRLVITSGTGIVTAEAIQAG